MARKSTASKETDLRIPRAGTVDSSRGGQYLPPTVSSKPGWGKTVLGWFVVQEGQAGPPEATDADALISKYANAPLPAPTAISFTGPLPQKVDGAFDFAQVFDAAGVTPEDRDRVTKAQELLRSLPTETPAPVKKQIVEASLKAFGVPTDKIIEASVEEIQALEGFIQAGQSETQKTLTDGNSRIATLEADIARVKLAMQESVTEQEARSRGANSKKLEVQQILEFFGQEAVAKVVRDSPKLHEPQ